MAKDPAFLFYPGDVLQQIGMFNLRQKGVYLTLICLQKEQSSFSYEELVFIMSELSDFERKAIITKLTEKRPGEYLIKWLEESIEKRQAFSESRASNRKSTTKEKRKHSHEEDVKDIRETSVTHMENENEIENVIENLNEIKGGGGGKEESTQQNQSQELFIVPEMLGIYLMKKPGYVTQNGKDFPALRKIAEVIAKQEQVDQFTPEGFNVVKQTWEAIADYFLTHRLYKDFALFQIEKYFQAITSAFVSSQQETQKGNIPERRSTIAINFDAAAGARELLRNAAEAQNV